MERPLILLTNDDGYDSPGLLALADRLEALGELLIVAPAVQQSGMGRAWLPGATGAIFQRQVPVNGRLHLAYAVDGSPSQSVAHALLELAPRRPALAVSGINYGENVGTAVTASGTVGAAMQAAISSIPSIAVSLEMDKAFYHTNSDQIDFGVAAHFGCRFARRLLGTPLPPDVDLLKIDVPRDATPDTPWQMARQSRRRYFVTTSIEREALDAPARVDYTIDPSASEPGSDSHTLAFGRRVAVTPLSFDLTSRTDLDLLGKLLADGSHPAAT